jgi:Protein of unknown function (DUF2946)
MGAIRSQRILLAWIAMFALLGNVMAGMFCVAPVKRDVNFPSDLLGAMVICSEHGEQTVPDDGSAPPAPTKPCQICTAVASLLVTLIVGVLLALLPLAPSLRLTPPFLLAVPPRWCRAGFGSRAPPLPA